MSKGKANVSLIVKETLVCIVLAVFAVGLNFLLFGKMFMEEVNVASAGTYSQIEKTNYVVVNGNIQDAQNPTETYEASPTELETYQSEYRYEVGTINPFISEDSVNDLPSELVGQSGAAKTEATN